MPNPVQMCGPEGALVEYGVASVGIGQDRVVEQQAVVLTFDIYLARRLQQIRERQIGQFPRHGTLTRSQSITR